MSSPSWQWDPSRQAYYVYSPDEGAYVYADGMRVSFASQAQSPNYEAPRPTYNDHSGTSDSYAPTAQSHTQRSQNSYTSEPLLGFTALSIEDPGSDAGSGSEIGLGTATQSSDNVTRVMPPGRFLTTVLLGSKGVDGFQALGDTGASSNFIGSKTLRRLRNEDAKGKYFAEIPYDDERPGYTTLKGEVRPTGQVSISFTLQSKNKVFTEVFYIVDTIGSIFDFVLCGEFLFCKGIFKYDKHALINKEEMSAQVSYLENETQEEKTTRLRDEADERARQKQQEEQQEADRKKRREKERKNTRAYPQ